MLITQHNSTLCAQNTFTELKVNDTPIQEEPVPTFHKKANTKREKPKPIAPRVVQTSDTTTNKKKTLIYLDHSDLMRFDEEALPDIQVLIGNVKMHHDSAYLYCDSAYFNQNRNSFIAFGNVRIEQGDTLTITSRKLDYNGDTRLAYLTDSVVMSNDEVTLETDTLTYNRDTETGFYTCGGLLRDSTNTLTSKHGYYYTDTKLAEFNFDVVVESNDSATILSDTLTYDTETKIATILGPTTIKHKDETNIYTELGWLNTETNISQLLKKSKIVHEDGKIIIADTIYHDDDNGFSKAFSRVQLIDTVEDIMLLGNYAFYQEEDEIAIVTDSAHIKEFSQGDTTYIHADTLYTYAIDEENMFLAYHNARLYNNDAQGVADSITFFSGDSIIHLLQLPILWMDDQQITADTIHLFPEKDNFNRMQAINNAIIVIKEDTIHYNQMSGKEIVGYVHDEELNHIEVLGNAQSIFFPTDESKIIGLNSIESSYMTIYFKDGKLDRMKVFPSPTAIMYPMKEVTETMLHLPNFTWQEEARPRKPEDIFLRPKRITQKEIEEKRQAIKEQEKEDRKRDRQNEQSEEMDEPDNQQGSRGPMGMRR